MTAPTPGQASWTARVLILEGSPDDPDDYAEIIGRWDGWLDDEMRAAEEAGAKAAIDWQRAEDASPTAQDYDHAAELAELRDTLAEVLASISSGEFIATASAHLNKLGRWHKRGGIEQL